MDIVAVTDIWLISNYFDQVAVDDITFPVYVFHHIPHYYSKDSKGRDAAMINLRLKLIHHSKQNHLRMFTLL